jgi:lysozyme
MSNVNEAALSLIKRNEGCALTAYQDSANVWTVGYGHTPAVPGTQISQAHADQLLQADLDRFESAVARATASVPTSANQFSAMVSLAFNIGVGVFQRSTVLRKHLAGDHLGAADAFLLWNKGGGRVLRGLARRRGEERSLYLSDAGQSERNRAEIPFHESPISAPARTPSHRADPDHSADDLNRAELERIRRGEPS